MMVRRVARLASEFRAIRDFQARIDRAQTLDVFKFEGRRDEDVDYQSGWSFTCVTTSVLGRPPLRGCLSSVGDIKTNADRHIRVEEVQRTPSTSSPTSGPPSG